MTETVHVQFIVRANKRADFLTMLQSWDERTDNACVGFRADDYVARRAALIKFVDEMEMKLRRNEHKRNWREKPIEALFRLLMLEVEEFRVANEFFTVGESRPELVDIANFAMICWDRLGMLEQERNAKEQVSIPVKNCTPLGPSGDGSYRGPDGA